jgi:hypothetical protein
VPLETGVYMSYLSRAALLLTCVLVVSSALSQCFKVSEASAASRQEGHPVRDLSARTRLGQDSRPSVAPRSSTSKNQERACTQTCRKTSPKGYKWSDDSSCNSETESCSVQATTSDSSICQTDFDELLTRTGVCVPQRAL